MSNAQKNYLKKWAIALGCILILGLLITCIALGNPWHWIAFGVAVIIVVACVAVLVSLGIGTIVWHWRLMGECKTKWEEEMLAYWWIFMNYHSGNWEELIPRMIEEDTDGESDIQRKYQMELFERFKAVKAPRVLQW
jgi:NADH:ubiquinone oxidoreductase subunit K